MKKPNVLFIPIDDLRPQLGCYGHPQMITPHLDGLAGRGVVFKQAYCQVPVCGATRASLLTGRRPRRDRFVDYMTWVDHDLPGARTLPQHFRENGYATVAVGKVFHHHPDTSERSWTCPPWLPAPAAQDNWRNYLTEESLANVNPNSGNGPPYECADVPDDAYFDGQIADRAISELHRLSQADEPFFLAAGFLKPHLPFNAPTKYWDYYRRDDVPLADNPFAPEGAPGEAIHDWGELRNYFNVPKDGPLPDEMARTLVHGYYAATSYMDAQIGRLLGELESLGLSDNTVVVAWGDHGWQLGEHGLWCKHCNFQTSLNAPLIIRAPGMTQGASAEGIVEFLDVFPTLCELGGLSTPESLQGTSLVPALGDPTRQIKPAAYCRYNDGDSIRADNYLYTEWTDNEGRIDARMLYDHDADPDENQNISECSGLAEEVNRLSAMLAEIRSAD
jgi:iduronate 2-sulfatase